MAVSQDPFEEANRILARGQVAAAVPHLERAVASMPEGWKPLRDFPDRLELAFWDQGDFVAYVAYSKPTKKVIWTVPSYSRACYFLGFAALERQELGQAEAWIDRGLALEPDHPLLLCEKALILGYRPGRAGAADFYRRATTVRPWNAPWTARAFRGLGFELVEARQLDEAEAAFRRSLELEPGHPVATNELRVVENLRKGVVTRTTSGLTRGGGEDEARRN
jgi:tetratricopeptide (TPR) repeat protein